MKTVIIRAERCVGCKQCVFHCAFVHTTLLPFKPRIDIIFYETKNFPNKCRHCNPAPCQKACPTEAIYREENFNIVLINIEKCISCGSCAMACPFSVIRFATLSEGQEVPFKCDQCFFRLEQGKVPACVEVCKTGALIFEDLNLYLKERAKEKIARKKNTSFEVLRNYYQQLKEINQRG